MRRILRKIACVKAIALVMSLLLLNPEIVDELKAGVML